MFNGFCIFFIYLFLLTSKAYAYMDLGSASALLQIIISGFIGGLIAIKLYFLRIKNFFKRILQKKDKK